jgi:hypothetical protein
VIDGEVFWFGVSLFGFCADADEWGGRGGNSYFGSVNGLEGGRLKKYPPLRAVGVLLF